MNGRPDVLDEATGWEVSPVLIVPGQVWRSRGTGGHGTGDTVTVVRLTTNGRVTFARNFHKRGRSEARHTVDQPVFRRQYALEQAAPGEGRAVVAAGADALPEPLQPPAGEDEGWVTFDPPLRVQVVASAPPVAAEREEEPPPPPPAPDLHPLGPLDPEPSPPPHPAAPVPEAPVEDDPLEAFLAHGRETMARLDGDLAQLEEDRDQARQLLEAYDGKLGPLRDQRDRVARAITAALAAAAYAPTLEPAPEAPPVEAPPMPREGLPPRPRVRGRYVGGPQGTRLEWLLTRFREQSRWAVRDLAAGYAAAFGVDPRRAVMDISSTLIRRTGHKDNVAPAIRRVALGVYEVVQ